MPPPALQLDRHKNELTAKGWLRNPGQLFASATKIRHAPRAKAGDAPARFISPLNATDCQIAF
jgi:hypothetical protein